LAITGNRELGDGEYIEGGELHTVESPDGSYIWEDKTWIEERVYNISTGIITLDTERDSAREYRAIQYRGLDILDAKIGSGRVILEDEEKDEIDSWYKTWLTFPDNYINIDIPVEDMYPETPKRVQYYI